MFCQKCDGLVLHFWRKICINCKCPKAKHDLLPEEFDEDLATFEVLGVKIPEHKKLYKYIPKNTATKLHEKTAIDVDWVPFVSEMDDTKRNEKIDKYFEDLGGEKLVPIAKSEAAMKRKEQAAMQIPAHDFNPDKCDNLTDVETSKLKNYVDNIKTNYFGQGQVDVIESAASNLDMPFDSSKSCLNAINNNHDVNEMLHNMSINEKLICKGCGLEITSSFVKAERLGKDATWHPKCFKCKKCSQLLVDLIYFHFNNEIYCARDLATQMDIPRCSGCDELILVPEFTLADGKNYHIKHFCCEFCDKALAGHQYVSDEQTNNPTCLNCYDLHHANKCSICKGIIAPNQEGVSLKELHYHLSCFKCSNGNCAKALIGSRFCIKENIPFCSANCLNTMFN